MSTPLKTFICYAHEDRVIVAAIRKQLKAFERNQLLDVWIDGEILAGQDWDKSIKERLQESELILLFISADFLDSDYIEKTELQAALQRHRDGAATLIPIIVRACPWQGYFDIGKFQALPEKAFPIVSKHFPYQDDVHHAVAEGIQRTALAIVAKRQTIVVVPEPLTANTIPKDLEETKVAHLHRRDEAAWKASQAEDQIEWYEAYLEKYTLHIDEALVRIDLLEAAQLKQQAETRKLAKVNVIVEKAQKETENFAWSGALFYNGQLMRDLPQAPEMVFIEGGKFKMGGEENIKEQPIHEVNVPSFWMGKYQITFEEYDHFCEVTGRKKIRGKDILRGRRPVYLTWKEAQAYCAWLSEETNAHYRLPSEAEWEFAAKGGILSKGFKYSGSNDPDKVAWHRGNATRQIHAVGEKAANELGLHDMSGNLWEWCADHWHDNYNGAPTDGSAWTIEYPEPTYTLRGSAFSSYSISTRITKRGWDKGGKTYGFRIAKTI